MDIARVKLTLVERLLLVWDEDALQRIAKAIETEVSAIEEDEDFTADEVAELDRRRARRLSGESKGFTAKESIGMLRAAQAKDEAA